jgi:RNA polymerase sigma-70 factor (ECF subfamily)
MAKVDSEQGTDAQSGTGATPLSLLERVRANDPQAWCRLLDLYQPLVRFWCVRAGLGAEDVEDLTQEIFAATARGLAGFRRDRPGDTFRGWLRGITRNQLLLFRRHTHGKPQAEGGSQALANLQQVEDPLLPPGDEEAVEIDRVYQRALDQVRGEFAEGHWQVFWLTVIEGRTPASLAAELGLTVGNIRQIKSRILRRIKLEVGDLIE